MIKFTTILITSALLLVTSQVSAKVNVGVEKATKVNTQELVINATKYLNSVLNKPVINADNVEVILQGALITPVQHIANKNVRVSTTFEAE